MERTVRAGDLSVFVREDGPADGPPVLLLHGFPETGRSWRHQAPVLAAAGHRVIVPDLRGYGRTGAPRTGYDVGSLVADQVALLAALGVTAPVTVVGHDWGGTVAVALARRRPDLVGRLVVLNSPLGAIDPIRAWHIPFFQLPLLPDVLWTRRHARLVKGSFRHYCYDPHAVPDDVIAEYQAGFADPARRRAALAYYRALRPWSARAILAVGNPPACPSLVIWGAHDRALPVDTTKGVETLLPGLVRFAILPFAGHFVHEERPDEVSGLVVDFLAAGAPSSVRAASI